MVLALSLLTFFILRGMDFFKSNELLNNDKCGVVIDLPMALEDYEIFENKYLIGSMLNFVQDAHFKTLDDRGFLYFDIES